jgi:MFS family permease
MHGAGRKPGTHPILFLPLYLPFSLPAGFASVALGRRLHDGGVDPAAIGALMAALIAPQLTKILWAPLVDTAFTVRGWYAAAAVLSSLALAALGLIPARPSSLPSLVALMLLLSLAATFMSMAAERLMAHATAPDRRGQAGGWSQAGNLLGSAVGGGGGLWMATHLDPPWLASLLLAALPMVCTGALAAVAEPERNSSGLGISASLAEVANDVWSLLRSRPGVATLILFLLPVGSGAASSLVGALASDWRVSADQLAALAGLGSGAASLLGAIAGGYLSDRADRRTSYLLFGFLLAAVALGMAAAPRTPQAFIAFALAYSAAMGMCQAAFVAVTLETIGRGAAATKFSFFAAVSNAPIAYMALLEGWARSRWNAGGMLALEGVLGIGSGLLFLALFGALRPRQA